MAGIRPVGQCRVIPAGLTRRGPLREGVCDINPSFMEIAEKAVTGLTPDPEIYLEVRQELLTHLEDNAEVLRASGVREADAAAQYAPAFGSPLEMMEKLTQANAGCMRLCARV